MRSAIVARNLHLPLDRTLLMGILNTTPDSFSDGGRFLDEGAAIAQGMRLVDEGADIIDIGGESTRPGASPVSPEDEAARVLPPLRALAARVEIPLSIDTYKAAVARQALAAGARIVNDVWGLQRDPDMARVVAGEGAAVVVMHNRHEADPAIDIMADVRAFLSRSVEIALTAGVAEEAIMVDPGIGFGKTFEQNLICIARLPELRDLGFPILLGASRKSFIGRLLDVEAGGRLFGSIAAHVTGANGGANIIRAHDVAQHRDAIRVSDAIGAHRP